MTWTNPFPTTDAVDTIRSLGETTRPHEACGIGVYDPEVPGRTRIIPLANMAGDPETPQFQDMDPHSSFVLTGEQIFAALQEHIRDLRHRPGASSNPHSPWNEANSDPGVRAGGLGVLCWHTHPSGFVGPSTADLEHARLLRGQGPEVARLAGVAVARLRFLVVTLPGGEATCY
jgi:proteasome lid subunit RPN8/RPN11